MVSKSKQRIWNVILIRRGIRLSIIKLYERFTYCININYNKQPHIMAKSEIGFLKVIVRPCYALLSEFMEDKLKHCIANIDDTI